MTSMRKEKILNIITGVNLNYQWQTNEDQGIYFREEGIEYKTPTSKEGRKRIFKSSKASIKTEHLHN